MLRPLAMVLDPQKPENADKRTSCWAQYKAPSTEKRLKKHAGRTPIHALFDHIILPCTPLLFNVLCYYGQPECPVDLAFIRQWPGVKEIVFTQDHEFRIAGDIALDGRMDLDDVIAPSYPISQHNERISDVFVFFFADEPKDLISGVFADRPGNRRFQQFSEIVES
jgi:hypothetical protein